MLFPPTAESHLSPLHFRVHSITNWHPAEWQGCRRGQLGLLRASMCLRFTNTQLLVLAGKVGDGFSPEPRARVNVCKGMVLHVDAVLLSVHYTCWGTSSPMDAWS